MDIPVNMVCSTCHTAVPPPANFCHNCGKPLRTMPPSTSVSMQIIIYLISFFIAPLGLWYAWKYLKRDDQKSKIIGIVAIALTLVAVAIAVWTMAELFNLSRQFWNSLSGLGL
jgi:predicted permease